MEVISIVNRDYKAAYNWGFSQFHLKETPLMVTIRITNGYIMGISIVGCMLGGSSHES